MAKINSETLAKMVRLLSSWCVFRQKAHTYHWNVKGKHFRGLHNLFSELYKEAEDHMDEIAERVRQLGEVVPVTLSSASQNTVVTDDNNASTDEGMVEDLLTALAALGVLQTEICMEADDQKDNVSMDLCIQLSKWTDMKSWFLAAFLQKENDSKV